MCERISSTKQTTARFSRIDKNTSRFTMDNNTEHKYDEEEEVTYLDTIYTRLPAPKHIDNKEVAFNII